MMEKTIQFLEKRTKKKGKKKKTGLYPKRLVQLNEAI